MAVYVVSTAAMPAAALPAAERMDLGLRDRPGRPLALRVVELSTKGEGGGGPADRKNYFSM
jgi:hypothetical protein